MTDRKVMCQTSVIKIEIDDTDFPVFNHSAASFVMTEWAKVFFVGSEDADTVSALSAPIKNNFPPLSHVERCGRVILQVLALL